MDAEGYIRITGRLKEIINRGGEKISPREVDEVLMDHPAVAAGRHLRHAAPETRRGGRRRDRAARGAARRASARSAISPPARLADFKVPRKLDLPGRDPQGRDRQAAAHRARRKARADGVSAALLGNRQSAVGSRHSVVTPSVVMPGLDPGIHSVTGNRKTTDCRLPIADCRTRKHPHENLRLRRRRDRRPRRRAARRARARRR